VAFRSSSSKSLDFLGAIDHFKRVGSANLSKNACPTTLSAAPFAILFASGNNNHTRFFW
jgi:hypothetical protein